MLSYLNYIIENEQLVVKADNPTYKVIANLKIADIEQHIEQLEHELELFSGKEKADKTEIINALQTVLLLKQKGARFVDENSEDYDDAIPIDKALNRVVPESVAKKLNKYDFDFSTDSMKEILNKNYHSLRHDRANDRQQFFKMMTEIKKRLQSKIDELVDEHNDAVNKGEAKNKIVDKNIFNDLAAYTAMWLSRSTDKKGGLADINRSHAVDLLISQLDDDELGEHLFNLFKNELEEDDKEKFAADYDAFKRVPGLSSLSDKELYLLSKGKDVAEIIFNAEKIKKKRDADVLNKTKENKADQRLASRLTDDQIDELKQSIVSVYNALPDKTQLDKVLKGNYETVYTPTYVQSGEKEELVDIPSEQETSNFNFKMNEIIRTFVDEINKQYGSLKKGLKSGDKIAKARIDRLAKSKDNLELYIRNRVLWPDMMNWDPNTDDIRDAYTPWVGTAKHDDYTTDTSEVSGLGEPIEKIRFPVNNVKDVSNALDKVKQYKEIEKEPRYIRDVLYNNGKNINLNLNDLFDDTEIINLQKIIKGFLNNPNNFGSNSKRPSLSIIAFSNDRLRKYSKMIAKVIEDKFPYVIDEIEDNIHESAKSIYDKLKESGEITNEQYDQLIDEYMSDSSSTDMLSDYIFNMVKDGSYNTGRKLKEYKKSSIFNLPDDALIEEPPVNDRTGDISKTFAKFANFDDKTPGARFRPAGNIDDSDYENIERFQKAHIESILDKTDKEDPDAAKAEEQKEKFFLHNVEKLFGRKLDDEYENAVLSIIRYNEIMDLDLYDGIKEAANNDNEDDLILLLQEKSNQLNAWREKQKIKDKQAKLSSETGFKKLASRNAEATGTKDTDTKLYAAIISSYNWLIELYSALSKHDKQYIDTQEQMVNEKQLAVDNFKDDVANETLSGNDKVQMLNTLNSLKDLYKDGLNIAISMKDNKEIQKIIQNKYSPYTFSSTYSEPNVKTGIITDEGDVLYDSNDDKDNSIDNLLKDLSSVSVDDVENIISKHKAQKKKKISKDTIDPDILAKLMKDLGIK